MSRPAIPSLDATSYVVNCSTLFSELPLLERAAAARAVGFEEVEFWWPFDGVPVPGDRAVEQFIASIQDFGMRLTGLNFWSGEMSAGDKGRLSTPGHSTAFTDNAEVVAEIGRRTGCTTFNALYGLNQGASAPEAQEEIALERLEIAANMVGRIDGTVLIEAISGADAYPLKTAEEAMAVVDGARRNGVQNVALLADFYHLAANGDDVVRVIDDYVADFGHIQLADSPGRGAPGTGGLPLIDWVSKAYAAGYSGKVGLEYKQDRNTAFDWLS